MNEVLKQMKNRRSVRSFTDEQVREADLSAVLDAAVWAPSGLNAQSSRIVVLQKKEDIEELRRLNASLMGDDSRDPFYGALTVLVVLADPSAMTYLENGCLLLGSLLLAAYSVGLGSCWIHRAKEEFESEEGKAMLRRWGIPENYVGIGHCILGYPKDGFPEPKPRNEGLVIRP